MFEIIFRSYKLVRLLLPYNDLLSKNISLNVTYFKVYDIRLKLESDLYHELVFDALCGNFYNNNQDTWH